MIIGMLSSSCTKQSTKVDNISAQNIEINEENTTFLTNEKLKNFFVDYFNHYDEEISLGEGMCYENREDLVSLDKNCNLDLPRRVAVGTHVIGKTIKVEDVVIQGIQDLDEACIYFVDVITTNKSIDKKDFEKNYQWHNTKHYYEMISEINAVNLIQDEICVKRRYWMYVKRNNDNNSIQTLCEVNPLQIDKQYGRKIDWNQSITQMPYPIILDEVTHSKIQQKVLKMIESEKIEYQNKQFDREYSLNRMRIESTWGSTKLKPKLKVNVPLKVVLTNDEVIYYQYNYLVELGQNTAFKISFMGRDTNYDDQVRQLKLTE